MQYIPSLYPKPYWRYAETKGTIKDVFTHNTEVTVYTEEGDVYKFKCKDLYIARIRVVSGAIRFLYRYSSMIFIAIFVIIALTFLSGPTVVENALLIVTILMMVYIAITIAIALRPRSTVLIVLDNMGQYHCFVIPKDLISKTNMMMKEFKSLSRI